MYKLSRFLQIASIIIFVLCMIPIGLMALFPNAVDWGNGLGPGLLMYMGLYYVLPFSLALSFSVFIFKKFDSDDESDRSQDGADADR